MKHALVAIVAVAVFVAAVHAETYRVRVSHIDTNLYRDLDSKVIIWNAALPGIGTL